MSLRVIFFPALVEIFVLVWFCFGMIHSVYVDILVLVWFCLLCIIVYLARSSCILVWSVCSKSWYICVIKFLLSQVDFHFYIPICNVSHMDTASWWNAEKSRMINTTSFAWNSRLVNFLIFIRFGIPCHLKAIGRGHDMTKQWLL